MHRTSTRDGVALTEIELTSDAAAVTLLVAIEEREKDRHVLA
jgi:hypothetical protein